MHGFTRHCVNDLLALLNENGHNLPKYSRTLLHTRKNVVTRSMIDGQYIYYGVKISIEKTLSGNEFFENDIKLFINIDGLPLFKSSSMQLWPIVIQFGTFSPVVVALYGGNKKAPMKEFLTDFVTEMKILTTEPVEINNTNYQISIFVITCDAPVRALLKGIVQHTGYYSCERYTKKGFYDHGRVGFDKAQENVLLRTNGLFQANHYATPDSSEKCHQLSISSLSELPTDMISVFTLDYMHLVCLGVTRRMLYYLKGHYKGIFES